MVPSMPLRATLPPTGRDLRLDLFRGVANWAIFLDHIPNNVVNWVTTRNYGFSDAADLFIFISGYTVAFVFAKTMIEKGFVVGATRRSRWEEVRRGSVVRNLLRTAAAAGIDVHVIARGDPAGRAELAPDES